MEEAQDMFRNANKVTRPEKALILGFMAGSRGNYIFYFKIYRTISISERKTLHDCNYIIFEATIGNMAY